MKVFYMLPAVLALPVLLRLTKAKLPLPYKLIFNTLCGYAMLILLNLFSCFTGAAFSMNIVTAVVTGFLGLPGIVLLFAVRALILNLRPAAGGGHCPQCPIRAAAGAAWRRILWISDPDRWQKENRQAL